MTSIAGPRRVFITDLGYIGLGPPEICSGDIICIIHWASTLFLVRPGTLSEGIFALVGESYIHGLMDGEGLKLGQLQNIVLS